MNKDWSPPRQNRLLYLLANAAKFNAQCELENFSLNEPALDVKPTAFNIILSKFLGGSVSACKKYKIKDLAILAPSFC
tara:strand:- start:577 stop:810 length:234 start_codon:yes stop_codon:yes gene_type:complete